MCDRKLRSRQIQYKKLSLKRHNISVGEKIKVLDRLRNGEKVSFVALTLNLNEAHIRSIQKREDKIRSSVAAGCSISSTYITRSRAPILDKMEQALGNWMVHYSKNQVTPTWNDIRIKALKIYDELKENGEPAPKMEFVASKGWYDRFYKRFTSEHLDKLKEPKNDTCGLNTIIEKGGYRAQQVFNATETEHYWKRMSNESVTSKNEKPFANSAVKDRVSLILCTNASGDFFVKPMLVCEQLKSSVKKLNKSAPVYCAEDIGITVTSDLFEEWFRSCFIPSVRKYLTERDLEFKVLLLLENTTNHPKSLSHPNVKILFLQPPTSLLQPLNQGIILTFKANYIKNLLGWVSEKVKTDYLEVTQACKLFRIKDSLKLIDLSFKEINPRTINNCWENIWPGAIHSINTAKTSIHLDEEENTQNFTLSCIKEGLDLAQQLETFFLTADPSDERSAIFKTELRKCMAPYEDLYKHLSYLNEQSFISVTETFTDDNGNY